MKSSSAPFKKSSEYGDIVQREPASVPKPLASVTIPGVYWVDWSQGNGATWELCVVTATGYVQELSGARRTLPRDRVAGLVVGPVLLAP